MGIILKEIPYRIKASLPYSYAHFILDTKLEFDVFLMDSICKAFFMKKKG